MIDKKKLNQQLKFLKKQNINYNMLEVCIIDNDIELTINNGIYSVLTLEKNCKADIRATAKKYKSDLEAYLRQHIVLIEW